MLCKNRHGHWSITRHAWNRIIYSVYYQNGTEMNKKILAIQGLDWIVINRGKKCCSSIVCLLRSQKPKIHIKLQKSSQVFKYRSDKLQLLFVQHSIAHWRNSYFFLSICHTEILVGGPIDLCVEMCWTILNNTQGEKNWMSEYIFVAHIFYGSLLMTHTSSIEPRESIIRNFVIWSIFADRRIWSAVSEVKPKLDYFQAE